MNEPFEPFPPHDRQAEEAVLGSILIDPDCLTELVGWLRAEDFYVPKHRDTYAAMVRLHAAGTPPDFALLTGELERIDRLRPVGGLSSLAALLNVVPTSVHAAHYAGVVQRLATMRRLIQAGGKIAGLGYEAASDLEGALTAAEAALFAVTQRRAGRDFRSLRDVLAEYLESTGAVGDPAGPAAPSPRIPTGFLDLDHLLGGLARADLIILAARPGVGKTALSLAIARHAAVSENHTVALFSLEMARLQLAGRLLAMESAVDGARLRAGRLASADLARLREAVATLCIAPIYLDDSAGLRITEVRSRARRLHAVHPVDLLIVDYLQLVGGSGANERAGRVQEVSEVSRGLKALAREINAPVLALSQLSRAVEQRAGDHVPRLADLRDSGQLEADADVVLLLHREDRSDRDSTRKGMVDVHVAKHRNGPLGVRSLRFLEASTRFVDLLREEPGWRCATRSGTCPAARPSASRSATSRRR